MSRRLPQATPLPPDSIALHIGVHKTGTTALQAALADARAELSAQGVLYPGRGSAQHGAAMTVLDRPWGWAGRGGSQADPQAFGRVAEQARSHPGRVVISSETFCQTDDEQAARVIAGLGRDRTHVIVGLRNLGRLLPSTWQQYLKAGRSLQYERWLEAMFDPDYDGTITPTFWQRNDHGAVVRRWSTLVGPENMTVLILENVDHDALFVAFAQLLDVPEELLTTRKHLNPNRSMTAAEAEFLRRLNAQLKGRLDWPAYREWVRRELVMAMLRGRRPGADEPRLHTPDWALDAAAERAARDVAVIRESGVHVLGDLDALAARVPSSPPVDRRQLASLPTDAVVEVVAHQILALADQPKAEPPPPRGSLGSRIRRRVRRLGAASRRAQ